MAMNGYTKLFNSIIASTIWDEQHFTRIVWITMLAMANAHGNVESSLTALAMFARVTIPECEKALAALEAPDKGSRSKDYEGRRIVKIDGGWKILNHNKYRDKLSEDDRREYMRNLMRARRARHNSVITSVSKRKLSLAMLGHTDTDTDTDTNTNTNKFKTNTSARALVSSENEKLALSLFEAFWLEYPYKLDRALALEAWLPLSILEQTLIPEAVKLWKQSEQWKETRFIPAPVNFLKKRRWESRPMLAKKEKSLGEQLRELEQRVGRKLT